MRRSPALLLTAALAAAALAGCSDDGGGDRLASGDDFSVEAALAELPTLPDESDDIGIQVVVFDLDAAARANDAGERPSGSDEDEVVDWLRTTTGIATDGVFPPIFLPPAQVFGNQSLAQVEEVEAELGWSVLAVDAVAEVVLPPERFAVVTGDDLGEDTLTDAGLEPDDAGIVSVGEGEDGETDVDDITPVRPIGAPLRMAADGDRIAVSGTTDDATEWLEGDARPLTDEEDLRAIAAALDDDDAISAYLTVFPEGRGFTAVGIGWSVDDGAARMTLAFAYDGERAAEEGVDDIRTAFEGDSTRDRRSLTDVITIDEVEAEGSLVVVEARPGREGRPQTPLDMLFGRDGPFA